MRRLTPAGLLSFIAWLTVLAGFAAGACGALEWTLDFWVALLVFVTMGAASGFAAGRYGV